jgi:hypothetical protein
MQKKSTNKNNFSIATWKYSLAALSVFLLPFIVNAHAGDEANHITLLGTNIGCKGSDCGWEGLMILAQGIISFIIQLSIPVAAGLFIYAGFLYVTAVDDGGKVTKAKEIFKTTFWGFVIILGAWLIVYTAVAALVDPKYLDGTGEDNANFLRFLQTDNTN